MTLANQFPQQAKQESLQRQLHTWRFLYLFCKFVKPVPKNKFLLLMNSQPLLFFIVNSQVNRFNQQPNILRCHVKLEVSSYDFLIRDSYLACHETITENDIKYEEVENQLMNDFNRLKGVVTETQKTEICEAVRYSPLMSGEHKKIILKNITSSLNP